MDPRLTFNEDPAAYDRLRPTYAPQLFADLLGYSGMSAAGHALEIGIGTGQAMLPILQTGCSLTAVELGGDLARFVRDKYAAYPRFSVIQGAFEDVPLPEGVFDLVYAASSFHWIAPEVGIPRVWALLRPGGVFAWISVQPGPSPENTALHEAVQRVYSRYPQHFPGPPPEGWAARVRLAEEKLRGRAETLAAYGFADIRCHRYTGRRVLATADYLALLGTYSDHRVMPDGDKAAFMAAVGEAIDAHGGCFALEDQMLLCMGKKEDIWPC